MIPVTFDASQVRLFGAGYRVIKPLSGLSGMVSMAMTVIEVEAATGVSADAIRWYVRKGVLRPRRNSGNGYYQFNPVDLRELRFIGRAQNLGFTLVEIRDVLAQSRRRESPCPAVRDIVKRRLVEVSARLDALHTMEVKMRRALRLWNRMPDGVPHGEEVCRLVDALSGDFDLRAARSLKIPARRRQKPSMGRDR